MTGRTPPAEAVEAAMAFVPPFPLRGGETAAEAQDRTVRSILTAAYPAIVAAERERIAQAIEAANSSSSPTRTNQARSMGYRHAARIAREVPGE